MYLLIRKKNVVVTHRKIVIYLIIHKHIKS